MKLSLAFFSSLLLLASCSKYDEIDSWMDHERAKAAANYKKSHKPQEYSLHSVQLEYQLQPPTSVEPFSPYKLKLSVYPGARASKGILENYDLAEMKYVGYITDKNKNKAFVDVGGTVYAVEVGTPIGKDYGKVIAISSEKISIQEHVESSEGLWIPHDAELNRASDEASAQ